MVAILLAVGQGKLSLDYVQQMFLDPTPNSWPSDLEKAPAHGLYLTDVCYNPKYSAKDDSEMLHKSSYSTYNLILFENWMLIIIVNQKYLKIIKRADYL